MGNIGHHKGQQQATGVARDDMPSLDLRRKGNGLYDILGVEPTATVDAVKKAYRGLALLHHPDRHAGPDKVPRHVTP
eukprot:gene9965-8846_t